MANKQNFTPEEWTKISESVMLAGMAVSAAEPSGLWGTLKEAFASGSAVAAAKADASSNELIKAVIANLETSEGRSAVQDARESGGEMICARLNDKVADARSNMNAMKRTSG